MRSTKLSITILTYNRAKYLQDCLESVIGQMTNEIEVIVSDNASTDNTEDVVKKYQNINNTIKYFKSESNTGFDGNVIDSIRRATGEYVWLFGDDDIFLPGAVGKVLKVLNEINNLSLVYANHSIYSIDLKTLIEERRVFRDRDVVMNNEDESLSIISNNLTFMSALVMRRSLCLGVPGIEQRIGHGFTQFYIALYILIGRKSYLIADPCVGQRSGNSKDDFKKYIELFVVEVGEIFKAVRYFGYGKIIIRKTINQTIKYCMIRKVASLKRINPSELKGRFRILFKYYYSYPVFWIAVVPFFIIPSSIIKQLYKLYKVFK